MKILDGKKLSERIIADLKKKIKKSNLKLRLVVIQIGENAVSQVFIDQKEKLRRKTGIAFKSYKFSAKISSSELKKAITRIVKNPINSGVIIQLPLPKRFEEGIEEFLNLISQEKDIDVLSEKSLGKFYQGALKILPPTINGILYLLKNYQINLKGRNVVVVGAGRLVGSPLAVQLLKEKATLSVLNEFTRDTIYFTKKADILISGVGKPNLIKASMIKKGVVIIDAGLSFEKEKPRNNASGILRGRLVGDVDFKSVSKKASYITPVPGGVGPMTVACLLENLVKINKSR